MYKKSKETKIKETFNKIAEGIDSIVSSGEYEKFLKFCNSLHNYSFNNKVLIYLQNKEATIVKGFKAWEQYGRKVKKGEKGIQILYPIKRKKVKETKSDNDEKEEDKFIEYMIYGITYVFDVSQTEGEELPILNKHLYSNNMHYFLKKLENFCEYPIIYQEIEGEADGYWSRKKQHIVLRKNLSIDDKVNVLLHEMTHALYDDFDYKKDRALSETFVESVAYIVADYFGLNTSISSFGYITSWTKGEPKKVIELGDKIQKTAKDFIEKLDDFESKTRLENVA